MLGEVTPCGGDSENVAWCSMMVVTVCGEAMRVFEGVWHRRTFQTGYTRSIRHGIKLTGF